MLKDMHRRLGIPADYGRDPHIPRQAEATELVDIGPDKFGRPQRLTPRAAASWRELSAAAAAGSIELVVVSAFRSVEYQARLFEQKLNRGETIDAILRQSAAPGYSQHHTGHALDLATPSCEPLTEAFAVTAAFRWLEKNAARFGFSMPYERGNAHGFAYEPWHWCCTP